MLRLASDADVHGAIIRGLRRRLPGLDLVRAQDALPEGTPDSEILAWAAVENRILITNDRNTMVGFAYQRVAAAERVPGLIATTNQQSIGSAIARRAVHAGGRDQGSGGRLPALPRRRRFSIRSWQPKAARPPVKAVEAIAEPGATDRGGHRAQPGELGRPGFARHHVVAGGPVGGCFMIRAVLLLGLFFLGSTVRAADDSPANQAANTWVKRSPSGRMAAPIGYESAFAWDPKQRLLIRMAAHATDGFEQLAEVWTFDPQAGQWKLREPNTSPPGACRLGQHVFDTLHNKYLRFPGTSGDHGWQWFRELYMNESSVWAYDLETNAWRNMRPIPEPMIYRQHFASWDGKLGRAVVFGGAGSAGVDTTSVYNPHTNTWDIKKAAHQPAGRLAGNMAWCAANGLHIAFGAEGTNKDFQGYDIQKNEWRDLKPASLPPTHGNEAVLAYDSLNDVLLCVIIDREGKEMERVANYTGKRHLETWAYTPSNNSWKKMSPKREPDPGGIRCRMMTFAPELNLAFFDVRDQHPTGGGSPEVQVWSYRYAASSKQPPPPPKARPEPGLVDDLVASVISAKEVRLSWKAPGPDGIKGYVIERAPVEVYSEDELRFVKGPTPSPKEGPNVAGIKAIGEFTALAEPVAATSYTDKTVDLSKPQTIAGKKIYTDHIKQVADGGKKYRYGVFAYRIRAVNNAGLKGGPSPYVLTIPSSPQQVFSKEGGGCTVKWVANPETNLAGYRVYRIDGPRPKGGGAGQKVHRLTDQPIKATTYTDGGFKGQARYYILAVDALGQEGYPSSPVWCNRRLKDLYAPFTGEWHQ